jgi:hypothetical protein
VKAIPKSPLEIDYEITPPATNIRDSTHGEFVNLALEADGVHLSHARVQLLRPASLTVRDAIPLTLGEDSTLAVDPPLVSFDPKGGREVHFTIRNNFPGIQNYVLELAGAGLTFLPARSEISIAAASVREIAVRIFADNPAPTVRQASIRISGAESFEQPFNAIPLARGEVIVYSRDLDGDGVEDRIVENQRVRVSFSGADGRWMEWIWKDSGVNLLPDSGLLAGSGPATSRAGGTTLEFRWPKDRRTVSLTADNRLTIEQDHPLPPEKLQSGKKDGASYTVTRPAANRAVYTLEQSQ